MSMCMRALPKPVMILDPYQNDRRQFGPTNQKISTPPLLGQPAPHCQPLTFQLQPWCGLWQNVCGSSRGTLLIHPCALQVVRCVPCSLATGVSRNLCREEEPSGSLVGRPRGILELPRTWPGPKAQCSTSRQRPWDGRAPPQQEAFHALGEPGQRAES